MLRRRGTAVTALARPDLDITDPAAVSAAIAHYRPGIVVNCAAWTNVDLAETHEAEALAVNGQGAASIAAACAASGALSASGARMIQLSTDYVFDGTATRPYSETAEPAPASAYGRTKLAGEQAVLRHLPETGYVVRTAWLYGAHGRNFIRTMIELERRQDTVAVVDDQRGQPTWTAAVAAQILALASPALRPVSTTPRAQARQPGSGWRGRCSACSAPTPTASRRPRAARWPGQPHAPPTASWATTAGPQPPSFPQPNGGPSSPKPFPPWPRRQPRASPDGQRDGQRAAGRKGIVGPWTQSPIALSPPALTWRSQRRCGGRHRRDPAGLAGWRPLGWRCRRASPRWCCGFG